MTLRAKLMREVASLGLPEGPASGPPVTDDDLAGLPEPAQRYLRFMGVVGRPRDWSFELAYRGRFRPSLRQGWARCEAWQYSNNLGLARIFHIRVRFLAMLPVLARDTYVSGRGRMLVRLLDLLTVTDGSGEEFDISELVTYLNDGILIAPSMLLVPEVSWSAVDTTSFDVAIADGGHTVRGRVLIDDRGAPVNFSTTDRFCDDPEDPKRLVRTRWTTPVEGWREVGGRRLWTRGRAVWHLPQGEFVYGDFSPIPETLAFNVRPSARETFIVGRRSRFGHSPAT